MGAILSRGKLYNLNNLSKFHNLPGFPPTKEKNNKKIETTMQNYLLLCWGKLLGDKLNGYIQNTDIYLGTLSGLKQLNINLSYHILVPKLKSSSASLFVSSRYADKLMSPLIFYY